MAPSGALAYARRHRRRFVEELKAFTAFPSVSLEPGHARDLEKCAAWLAGHLRNVGLEHAHVVKTRGHPIVYADWLHGVDQPTLIVYGHYDVVPADPLREWRSPPFHPTVRGHHLFGRGASDDKGQMFAHVKAIEAHLKTYRRLPVNVKCIFEGEEEVDSPNFAQFLRENTRLLRANLAVMSDNQMLAPGRPVINYGLRGNVRFELQVEGPNQDLHSGIFGGAIHNPLQVLCEILASLHDEHGRVTIPGFYDDVRTCGAREREHLADTAPSDQQLLKSAGTRRGWGESGYSLYERTAIRPALTLNGISGGSRGAGVKMIIPARASAKLSIRLVPDQEPEKIAKLFSDHVARVSPSTVTTKILVHPGSRPALVERDYPGMRAAAFAFRKGFGSSPVFLRNGGTFPVFSMLKDTLGVNTVMMGFALPDDHLHSPNEKFHLCNFWNGIETCIWFLQALQSKRKRVTGVRQPAWSIAYGD